MADLNAFFDAYGGFELVGEDDGAWVRSDLAVNVGDHQ